MFISCKDSQAATAPYLSFVNKKRAIKRYDLYEPIYCPFFYIMQDNRYVFTGTKKGIFGPYKHLIGLPVSDAVFKICSLDCMATLDVIQFLL